MGELKITKFGIVGQCRGGLLAIRYALLHPEKINGVVVACPPGPTGLPMFK